MRFAFVTPRYGAEIGCGPEHAARLLAEQVSERHDVDVLTTTARDPLTWKNEYTEGSDRVRSVLVRRFSVNQLHDQSAFRQLSSRVFAGGQSRQDEIEWVKRLGPSSPGLVDFVKRQHCTYDALVFFSLLHATTLQAFAVAPERSILFPCLQLHAALRFGIWSELLMSARAVGYLSGAERKVARAYMRYAPSAEEIVGVGVEAPQQQTYPRHQQDPADNPAGDDEAAVESDDLPIDHLTGRGVPFRRRHRLYGPIALYGGRVEPDNGCEEMLEYFDTYSAGDGETTLVLMGVKMMKVPEAPSVRLAGVLPDRERMIAYEAADVTLAPSSSDLLAHPVLESLAVGTPVLAAALNEAAVEHVRRSNAGLYYGNREEFVEALRLMTTNTRLREKMGANGRQYIRQHYRWEAVLGRFERLVGKVKR
ncbi:MAG TPA: glycosyltransferase [Vicinamibacterales bacterium]